MTDSAGNVRTKRTNTFGYFSFADVLSGEIYTIAASGKGYNFSGQTKVITVNDAIDDLNFIDAPVSEKNERSKFLFNRKR